MPGQLQAFVRGMDGNLWLELAPLGDMAQTIQTRQLVDTNVLGFGVLPNKKAYIIDGSQNPWFEFPPYGPTNRSAVDATVNACYPVFPSSFCESKDQRPRAARDLIDCVSLTLDEAL